MDSCELAVLGFGITTGLLSILLLFLVKYVSKGHIAAKVHKQMRERTT